MTRVRLYLPSADRYMDASEDAFERVWSAEGWVLAPEPDPAPAPKKASRGRKAAAPDVEGDG